MAVRPLRCYGLDLAGLEALGALPHLNRSPPNDYSEPDDRPSLAPVDRPEPGGNPPVTVRFRCSPLPPPTPVGADYGAVRMIGGHTLQVNRSQWSATWVGPPIDPDELVHPYLSALGQAFNRWLGREAFHAGAFEAGGAAWIVVGPREAGKSTLLAMLAAAGYPVLVDDRVITDGQVVFAGPRCLDLRQPLPGMDVDLRPVREGRLRLTLAPIPDHTPVGGWVFLNWADHLSIDPIPAGALLCRLARADRSLPRLASDPLIMLNLAARPAWTLARPRRWEHTSQVIAALTHTIGTELARRT